MTFRKFGRSDDQKVEVDKKDEQGLAKTASWGEKTTWTREDEAALQAESEE